jgi:OsmC-like protein
MDRSALRAVQEPLKARYRELPETAVITLSAEGRLGEGISCSVNTGRTLASAGVTLKAVATSIGVDIRDGTVHADGDIDFRGTLAVAKEAPVGFREIRLRFDLDSDASADDLDTLIRLTERYCVVLQTLAASPLIKVEHGRASSP